MKLKIVTNYRSFQSQNYMLVAKLFIMKQDINERKQFVLKEDVFWR